MTLLTLMKYFTVHVVMQCLYEYIFEVDPEWEKRNQGPLSEWKQRPGEQWVTWSSNH